MKLRLLIALSIILIIGQLFLAQSPAFNSFQILLVVAWIFFYVFGINWSLYLLATIGLFFELITFNHLGVLGISFTLTLIIIFLSKNIFAFFKEDKNVVFNFSGLLCNTIIFFVLSSIIAKNFLVGNLVASLILNSFLFILLSRFSKPMKTKSYV